MGLKGRKIRISERTYRDMLSHARETYPHECCGILMGDGEKRLVKKLLRTENRFKGRLRDRYSIDPKDLLRAEREARTEGMEILGFYHSHPDHPPRPSSFDREMAWPLYSYIIIAVNAMGAEVRAWWLEDEDGEFREERIEVEG